MNITKSYTNINTARKKPPIAMWGMMKIEPRALVQITGLAQPTRCVEMGKATSKWKIKALHNVSAPDTDMIRSVEILRKFLYQPLHEVGESSKSPPTESKVIKNDALKGIPKSTLQSKAATKEECPPKLRPILGSEEGRVAQTAVNLAVCSAAISGVEAILLPLTNGSNRQFLDSMRIYLCSSIAQYMNTGPASTPLVLHPRPANPPLRAPEPGAKLHPSS